MWIVLSSHSLVGRATGLFKLFPDGLDVDMEQSAPHYRLYSLLSYIVFHFIIYLSCFSAKVCYTVSQNVTAPQVPL